MNFIDLSSKQFRLLKKIARNQIIRTEKYTNDDIEHLKNIGLVKIISCDKEGDYYYEPQITESGKSYIYFRKKSLKYEKNTRLISVTALVISLITAFTPFGDWCKTFIINLFK